ncbi:ATP-dependent RNA helicase ddx23-like [Schistocerca gregaria]|uniref:ATP-dependent RNA helicase ddx23-like n=1 Tax=Schistocerca gregaria TaxID=7010 RepID=UPI00211E4BD3|nr:ATP-dependent RNA helicase ddx23-like [Schistocerca gregaria]
MTGSTREPISLEDLIKKKKTEQEDTGKPVFLTKAQRREQALLLRQEAVKREIAERAQGSQIHERPPNESSDSPPMYIQKYDWHEREKEIEEIKRQRLGIVEKRKRVLKPSDKFNTKPTHWDLSEDTSNEMNSLYNKRVLFRPQFGTGSVAGIDEEKQLKAMLKHTENRESCRRYDERLRKIKEEYKNSGLNWREKRLEQMTARDWRIFKEDHNISTKGGGIPHPIRYWHESGLPDWLLSAVKDMGYENLSAIQMQAIPIGLEGRDMIGIAETGSGKTAAFLIPLLVYISRLLPLTSKTDEDGPCACVLAPTRELAQQIEQEALKFTKYKKFRVVLLVGGVDIQTQVSALRKGCELIVATPGRLVDLLRSFYIVLSQCNYVVLDEGDQMIDLGFESQLLEVLEAMPRSKLKSEDESSATQQEPDKGNASRTMVLFSATMPPAIERIAAKYLKKPAYVYIGEVGRTVDRIKQVVEFVKGEADKRRRLQEILEHGPPPPIIIFLNQKKNCDMIAKFLSRLGYIVAVLHSGKPQAQRELAIEEFRAKEVDILVATNVIGRGLDIKGVTHVINYDLPKTIDEYTHRIGRTGRAGEDGLATSFIKREDVEIMPALKQMLIKTGNKVPKELHELANSAQNKPMF